MPKVGQIAGLLLGAALSLTAGGALAQEDTPNILLIISDDTASTRSLTKV